MTAPSRLVTRLFITAHVSTKAPSSGPGRSTKFSERKAILSQKHYVHLGRYQPVQAESGREHISSELTHRYSVSAERLTQLVIMGQKRSQDGGQLYCTVRRMLKNAYHSIKKVLTHSSENELQFWVAQWWPFELASTKRPTQMLTVEQVRVGAHSLCELWVRTPFNLQYAFFNIWRTVQYIWPRLGF